MFISKKDYNALIERVNQLESKVNRLERMSTTSISYFGAKADLNRVCIMLPKFIEKKAAAVFDELFNSRIKKAATLFLDIQ